MILEMISPEQVAEMLYPASSTDKPGPIPTVVRMASLLRLLPSAISH